MHEFNWVDIVIIGIVAFSIVISFFRGFVREVVSLIIWVIGFFIALKYADLLQAHLSAWISSEMARYVVCFIALFLLVLVSGFLINSVVQRLLNRTGLGLTDRMIGVFFGAARGMIVVCVLLMFVSVGTAADNTALAQSRLAPHFRPAVTWLHHFLPKEMSEVSQWVKSDFDITLDINNEKS